MMMSAGDEVTAMIKQSLSVGPHPLSFFVTSRMVFHFSAEASERRSSVLRPMGPARLAVQLLKGSSTRGDGVGWWLPSGLGPW